MPSEQPPNGRGNRLSVRATRRTASRRLRYFYLRFVRLRGTPTEIARGLAVGVFAGMYPFFGLQTILAVGIAVVFKGNKLAAVAGTWVSNPLTYVPIYAFNFQVGRLLLRSDITFAFSEGSPAKILQAGSDFAEAMLVGSTVVGTIAAGIAYVGAVPVVRRIRKRMGMRR